MYNEDAMDRLARVASLLKTRSDVQQYLKKYKGRANRLHRQDFVWFCIVESFGTLGGVRGVEGLMKDKRVTYSFLRRKSMKEQQHAITKALRDAKVNYWNKKASALFRNLLIVEALGGPTRIKNKLLKMPGRDAKIAFLQIFHQIGPKYGRNIMMDVYHPEFRDSIALDARIKSIASALGLTFKTPDEAEPFFVEAAHRAGLNGWELDRMMFGFKKDFIQSLLSVEWKAKSASTAR